MWHRIIRPRVDSAGWHRFPQADLWEHLRAMDMLFFE